MVYRRYPLVPQKRYLGPAGIPSNPVAEFPLPNEKELLDESQEINTELMPRRISFLDHIIHRIDMEEIILIGLILILLLEGIQDEVLLIVLLYILLSGKD